MAELPQTPYSHCGAAAHGAPGAAVVVQDGATTPHGEDVGGGAAPDTIKVIVVPLLMALQAAAVVVQDGAIVTHGEDIGGGAAPDTIKPICGAAAHGAPGAAVVVQDGASSPPRRRHRWRSCPRHH